MNYANFIMAVFTIYLVYYALNFLYDAFLKKEKTDKSEEEEVFTIGEDYEEVPHNVEEDFGITAQKKNEKIEYVTVSEAVEMDIETQGIPVEMLIAKGKNMFANISY